MTLVFWEVSYVHIFKREYPKPYGQMRVGSGNNFWPLRGRFSEMVGDDHGYIFIFIHSTDSINKVYTQKKKN